MLGKRVLSAAAGIVLLAAVTYAGSYAISAAISILAVLGVNEFFKAAESGGLKPVEPVGYAACILPPLAGACAYVPGYGSLLHISEFEKRFWPILFVFVIVVILCSAAVFRHNRHTINDISITLLCIAYVPFLFTFVILTRNLIYGEYLIWLVFIGAWGTDTFAYTAGMLAGKIKILPDVSPKKTLEGFIGGLAGCACLFVLYGLYLKGQMQPALPLYHFIALGIACGVLSQIGDWSASAFKRYTGIKDYGRIMPGHGGVLDRFDSILFIAPVVYFYMLFVFKYCI